jgi:hypothetical protein
MFHVKIINSPRSTYYRSSGGVDIKIRWYAPQRATTRHDTTRKAKRRNTIRANTSGTVENTIGTSGGVDLSVHCPEDEQRRIEATMLTLLKDGTMITTELHKTIKTQCGCYNRDIKNARAALGVKSYRQGDEWYSYLPDDKAKNAATLS